MNSAFCNAGAGLRRWVGALCAIAIVLGGCRSPSSNRSGEDQVLELRLASEPDRIHPMLSRRSVSTLVERQIFLPLMQFHPRDLSLVPVLLETAPAITDDTIEGRPLWRYTMRLRPSAQWQDGTPVTGYDYLFTIKAALNPLLQNNQWRRYAEVIDSVQIDSADPKHFHVWVQPGLFSYIIACNLELYPEHYYDSAYLLRPYTLRTLKRLDGSGDTVLKTFAHRFSASRLSRKPMGCGPFYLDEWIPQHRITLQRVPRWWGQHLEDEVDIFRVNPTALVFHIIEDEISAVELLKQGKLHIVYDISPGLFVRLKGAKSSEVKTFTPTAMRYYYVVINNRHLILRNRDVRRALAHCVDVHAFIDYALEGLGIPVTGPIHPTKPYALRLPSIAMDLEQARRLLHKSGWKDSDGDGIRDSLIHGRRRKLVLDLWITGSETSRKFALTLKQNAAKAGIDIDIRQSRLRDILQRIYKGDFALAPLSIRQSSGLDELGNTWHSRHWPPHGKNFCYYSNPQVDVWLDSLHLVRDTTSLYRLYDNIQRAIYDDQPAVFLAAPQERIAVHRYVELSQTPIPPGFYLNWTKLHTFVEHQ